MVTKTIWLTGASSGIGFEIAKQLLNLNVKLILSSRNIENIRQTITKNTFDIKAKIFFCPIDLGVPSKIKECYYYIISNIGEVDILINNAGKFISKNFLNTTLEQYNEIMNVNLQGAFITTKCVLPSMISHKKGIIVNINSIVALQTFPYSAIYSASKAGFLAMMQSLREEVRKYGIKIINVLPGATATNIWGKDITQANKNMMSSPYEIAKIVVDTLKLCENTNSMIEEIIIKPQYGNID